MRYGGQCGWFFISDERREIWPHESAWRELWESARINRIADVMKMIERGRKRILNHIQIIMARAASLIRANHFKIPTESICQLNLAWILALHSLIDLYTKKMWEYHSPEISKVEPLLESDSNWTQAAEEESGASAQRVVN